MVYCNICGDPNADDSKFCNECGSAIVFDGSAEPQEHPKYGKFSKQTKGFDNLPKEEMGDSKLGLIINAMNYERDRKKRKKKRMEELSFSTDDGATLDMKFGKIFLGFFLVLLLLIFI